MSNSVSPTPTLLISHLPPKTLLGIDLLSFTSTPTFHGIKDLPPGAHFLYTGTTASFSLRSGEWFFVPHYHGGGVGVQDVRLRRWDSNVEGLVPIDERSEDGRREAMELRANLGRVWRGGGLLAYRLRARGGNENGNGNEGDEHEHASHARSEWDRLTEYISPAVLSRILGHADPDGTEPEPRERWTVSSASSASRDIDHIPGLTPTEAAISGDRAGEQEKELHFLPIDLKRTWREGAVGRERTEAAQDKSWALGDLIGRFSSSGDQEEQQHALTVAGDASSTTTTTAGEAQILGEMQFTFLMVLTLMNFSCLEQWKRLLGLILTCRSAVSAREGFFVKILRLLRLQLKHCEDVEGGLFEMDGDDGSSLLRKLLTGFRSIVDEFGNDDNAVLGVKAELENLENWVKEEYGWELRRGRIVRRGMVELEDGERVELEISGTEEDEETGEYAPVVVDMPEEGGGDVDMGDTEMR